MTQGNGREDGVDAQLEATKQVVEQLQDQILEIIETCARTSPECDPQAFPVAAGQAFVAQCLKTYGEYGFEEARKHAHLITDEMERAFRTARDK
jgi:hypothetical protein